MTIQVVYNEFEGFRCYGYVTDKPRRAQRMCDVFISCPPLRLYDVKPVVSGKIEIASSNRVIDRLEDASSRGIIVSNSWRTKTNIRRD